MSTVRISLTSEIEEFLDHLRNDKFRFLENAEIIRLILSEYYAWQKQKEVEIFEEWEKTLPVLELSDEEQDSLTQGIKELEKGEGEEMTVEEFLKVTKP